MTHAHTPFAVEDLAELAPFVRRAAALDATTLIRVQIDEGTASAFAALPFGCLAGRSVAIGVRAQPRLDIALAADELSRWLDDPSGSWPASRDDDWRGGLPPAGGWRRLDSVPDDVVRSLVAAGAKSLQDAALQGGRPRTEIADALLDSVVLTVSAGAERAQLTLRMVSALTRMGFLPTPSSANVDVSGRWLRVAGRYGSIYAERPGAGLGLAR